MDDALKKAEHYHDEAERYRALALIQDRRRGALMLSIAEHFYLLHDDFTALAHPQDGEVVRLKR